jgi:hypothetical protein
MKANHDDNRLRELAVAFHRIARNTPDLKVDPPAARPLSGSDAERRPMFRVRLRSSVGEARARMLVHERGAMLETRVGDGRPSAGDELSLDLRRGYRLDASTFDDAAQMAEVLYEHMTRRLAAVTEGAA